jgi:hypothetical protein
VDPALDSFGNVEALCASPELVGKKLRVGTTAFQPAAPEVGIHRLTTDRLAGRPRALADHYAAGELPVKIRRAYPLAATEAHRLMETDHTYGMGGCAGELSRRIRSDLPRRIGPADQHQSDNGLK